MLDNDLTNRKIKISGKAILAGMAIGLGGLANIICRNSINGGLGKLFGAILFSIGLLFVINEEYFLFTGLVRNLLRKEKRLNIDEYILVLLGNLIGAAMIGIIAFNSFPIETLSNSIDFFASKEILYVFPSSLICGFCISLAIMGNEKSKKTGLSGTLLVIFPVIVFVFLGADHCIADTFYMTLLMQTEIEFKSAIFSVIPIAIIGNILGGLIPPFFAEYLITIKE